MESELERYLNEDKGEGGCCGLAFGFVLVLIVCIIMEMMK